MEFSGERMVPGLSGWELETEHMDRYSFACQFVKNKSVLDAACGTGYGSSMMAEYAERVCGLDISEEAIEYAKENYGERAAFYRSSIEKLPFKDSEFDVVVSFETLEHVDEEMQDSFLSEISRVLKKEGILVISTPNHDIYKYRGENEFHKHEVGCGEFRQYLKQRFNYILFFTQKWEICDVISRAEVKESKTNSLLKENDAEYMVAVCSNVAIHEPTGMITVRGDNKRRELMEWALRNHHHNEVLQKNNQELHAHIDQLLQTERDQKAHIDQLLQTELNQKGHIELLLQSERDLKAQSEQLLQRKHELKGHIELLLQTERNQNGHIDQLMQSERELKAHVEQLLQSERDQKTHIEKLEQEKAEEQEVISQLESERAKKDEQIADLMQRERFDAEEIVHLESEVAEKENQLKKLEQNLNNKRGHIELLLQSERDQKAHIAQLLQTERNQKGHIEQLLQSERDLHNQIDCIQGSRAWKLVGVLWKIRDVVLPLQSRRRAVLKYSVKFLRHPIRFVQKINKQRVRKALHALKSGEIQVLNEGVNKVLPELEPVCTPPEITDVSCLADTRNLGEYAHFALPEFTHPLVSIVIPVYNQFHYTYACLDSIAKNSGDVPYEVIIANDCSTDLTSRIEEIVSGVRLITNEKNLRFLLNCNNAAKFARGKYILFLNNDTQVQANWLKPLVDLIESDERIGMVGSKLVYPDGRLQEAGGILWQDGSAWNYGHGQDPAMPEYNYVKDVDYISGASIMIRRDLWEQLGGFDEQFAPAYYEDTDLAFSVRKAGYRVVYQPLSVVVHFEGVSNGNNTSQGLKSYQVRNQKVFYEKWKDVLREHRPNAVDVFRARERSLDKKVLLFVDHYVPEFDKDAGSRSVFGYIKLFVHQGYSVKFIGDNFYHSEPYTTVLEQLGVEVLCGDWYYLNWKTWLTENAKYFDYAFLNRPHIAVNYIDILRKNSKARIAYYGHDLHFLRTRREYELTGEQSLLRESMSWHRKEFALMQKMDTVYYPSYVEVDMIHQEDESIAAQAIPVYLFDQVPAVSYQMNARRDLFFIGGFAHKPNADAVKWFAEEIMPLVRQRIPDIRMHIAGSHMPDEIKNLAGDTFVIEGMVSDERLGELYKQVRMIVIPLRFGAGVKGKVIEGMYNGVPIVTTSCGAEGITDIEKAVCIEDEAKKIAQEIVERYNDEAVLKAMSEQGIELVRKYFSEDYAASVLGKTFDFSDRKGKAL